MLLLRRALWCGWLLGALGGCGYRLVRPSLPGGLEAVYVPVFRNQTAEPGAEAFFTDALRRAFAHGGLAAGPESPGKVDGEVLYLGGGPNVIGNWQVLSYRISGSVRLRLVRQGLLVREVVVSGFEDYTSGTDALTTESNRQAAVQRLADSMMRDGYEQLAVGP